MKHVEFLIWWRREDKANSTSFASKELDCNKTTTVASPLRLSSSPVLLDQNGFGLALPGQKMFESLGFGYYMIAVFSSKGITLRGIQM